MSTTPDEDAAAALAELDARKSDDPARARQIRAQYKHVRNWLANEIGLGREQVLQIVYKRVDAVLIEYLNYNLDHGWLGRRVDAVLQQLVSAHVEKAFRLATAQATANIKIEFNNEHAWPREKKP